MGFNPFSVLTSKIFGGLLLVSLLTLGPALWITRSTLADVRKDNTALTEWQTSIVDAIRLAADNPDVDKTTAAAQVQALGQIRIDLTNAVEDQNAAIVMMEQLSADAMAAAEQAQKQRAAAVRRAESLAAELRARSRIPAPADDMEEAVRRTQDELYEAGI